MVSHLNSGGKAKEAAHIDLLFNRQYDADSVLAAIKNAIQGRICYHRKEITKHNRGLTEAEKQKAICVDVINSLSQRIRVDADVRIPEMIEKHIQELLRYELALKYHREHKAAHAMHAYRWLKAKNHLKLSTLEIENCGSNGVTLRQTVFD